MFEEDRRSWQAVVMARQVWLVGSKVLADIYADPQVHTQSAVACDCYVGPFLRDCSFSRGTHKLPFGPGEIDWRWGPFGAILISVHLQAVYRPYALWHDNILEQSCLLSLLLVIWGDVTLATDASRYLNVFLLALVLVFIAGLYASQVRGRKLAKSAHQADLFSFGDGGGGGGGGGAPAATGADADFEVTQSQSLRGQVQKIGADRAKDLAASAQNVSLGALLTSAQTIFRGLPLVCSRACVALTMLVACPVPLLPAVPRELQSPRTS